MKLFKFFEGEIKKERVFTEWMDRMDDFHLGGIQEPPYGISYRHWNMLPQYIKDASREYMLAYIDGFESARMNRLNNPHTDSCYDIWRLGYLNYQRRTENL